MLIVAFPSALESPAPVERSVADRAVRAAADDYAFGAWQTPGPVTARPRSVWRSPTFYLVPFVLCYLLAACVLVTVGGAVRRAATFMLKRF